VENETQKSGLFIGRQREMAELRAALDSAKAGLGQLVMLAGEPGIGKTRTAQELASYAVSSGFRVLWGWCYERDGAPPYWPLAQLVRTYVENTSAEHLQSQMGPGAADIAEVIPMVREKLPDLEQSSVLDPDQARFRLFESITTFFKNAAQAQPLMLVLDDLHWADKPSLLLLEFLAKQMADSRMLVLGTYRDSEATRDPPLSDTLAQLYRIPISHSTVLGGLESGAVGQFLQAARGTEASQELVDAVYARTEGNPFFISEVIRLLDEEGDTSGAPDTLPIPQGILEVIGQRLGRLSEDCNRVLITAAVIGRQFDFKLLAGLTEDTTDFQLIELLEEALEARVLQEVSGLNEVYEFSHALVQATLLERLSSARKVRLHASVGKELERQLGDNPGSRAGELAHHFAEASSHLGTGKLIEYSLLAGEQALGIYAHEQALEHFRQGLAAKEGQPMDSDTAALMFGLGRAGGATLQIYEMQEGSINHLETAFNYYADIGDVAMAVAVAASVPRLSVGERAGPKPLLARALELVSAESHEAGRLLSQYGLVLGLQEGKYEDAMDALNHALEIASREGDVGLEIRTLAFASQVEMFHTNWEEGLEFSLRAIELGGEADHPRSEISARYSAASAYWKNGNLAETRMHAAAGLLLAEKSRDSFWLPAAAWFNDHVAFAEGDWTAAREYSDRGLAVADHDPRLLSSRTQLEYVLGEFDQAEVYLNRLIETVERLPKSPTFFHAATAMVIPIGAGITGDDSKFEIAEKAAEAVLESGAANPVFQICARIGMGLIAVSRGDAPEARRQHEALESLVYSGYLITYTCVDHILGLLANTMGEWEQAAGYFESALEFCRRVGMMPELAWSSHDYAEALLQRRGPGDIERAKSLLCESTVICTELGIKGLSVRLAALQELADLTPVRAPAYPDALTQREVDVIRLISAGRTDREIADQLIISIRTVTTHVGNILHKTGAANRAEAAAYAVRNGLELDSEES
jgi:DNA-binding CsgD family transcriptional regulator/tetratricopeptide (TPR) repeat protein